ncbi:MAG: multidrug effflux MFS transporter [Paracoccaceae bacterium]|nr:multidrug effflux MFS transporter [Paracoccaceae bacterium]
MAETQIVGAARGGVLPRKAPLVALLAAVTAIGPFSLQALSPALPAISVGFEVRSEIAQLMLSLSLVAMAVTTLIWGPVSDRLGRRPVMMTGMLLAGAGSALAALAPELWMAVLGRLMQAGGAVAGMVLARAVAQDLYGRESSAGVIGQITAAMVIAPMIAPALSGVIVDFAGWRGVFALVAVAAIGLAVLVRAKLPETAPEAKRESPRAILAGFGEIARNRAFWAHACFGACSLAAFLFFVGSAPYVMEVAYQQRPSVYGFYFMPMAMTYMLANIACGRLTRRFGGHKMIVAGGTISIVCMVIGVGGMASGLAGPLNLVVPALFHAIGAGFSVPNAVAGAVGAAPHRAGAASGLLGFIQFMTAAVTTQIAGFLPHDVAMPILIGMMILTAIGLSGYLLLERRR